MPRCFYVQFADFPIHQFPARTRIGNAIFLRQCKSLKKKIHFTPMLILLFGERARRWQNAFAPFNRVCKYD